MARSQACDLIRSAILVERLEGQTDERFLQRRPRYIHGTGFQEYALKSAPEILAILQRFNLLNGWVVDLGCGSGLSESELFLAEAIAAAGASLVYLSPYSPDFNPIENLWSKFKKYLRSVGSCSKETLHDAVQEALAQISLEDVRNWFYHCCYCFNEVV